MLRVHGVFVDDARGELRFVPNPEPTGNASILPWRNPQ
jgi:hypothetical protein